MQKKMVIVTLKGIAFKADDSITRGVRARAAL